MRMEDILFLEPAINPNFFNSVRYLEAVTETVSSDHFFKSSSVSLRSLIQATTSSFLWTPYHCKRLKKKLFH